jgi:hypothetical protein
VACTYDGLYAKLYVDGALIVSQAGMGPLIMGNTNGASLAGNSPSGDPFVGRMDSLRIYARSLTPAEICQDANKIQCD